MGVSSELDRLQERCGEVTYALALEQGPPSVFNFERTTPIEKAAEIRDLRELLKEGNVSTTQETYLNACQGLLNRVDIPSLTPPEFGKDSHHEKLKRLRHQVDSLLLCQVMKVFNKDAVEAFIEKSLSEQLQEFLAKVQTTVSNPSPKYEDDMKSQSVTSKENVPDHNKTTIPRERDVDGGLSDITSKENVPSQNKIATLKECNNMDNMGMDGGLSDTDLDRDSEEEDREKDSDKGFEFMCTQATNDIFDNASTGEECGTSNGMDTECKIAESIDRKSEYEIHRKLSLEDKKDTQPKPESPEDLGNEEVLQSKPENDMGSKFSVEASSILPNNDTKSAQGGVSNSEAGGDNLLPKHVNLQDCDSMLEKGSGVSPKNKEDPEEMQMDSLQVLGVQSGSEPLQKENEGSSQQVGLPSESRKRKMDVAQEEEEAASIGCNQPGSTQTQKKNRTGDVVPEAKQSDTKPTDENRKRKVVDNTGTIRENVPMELLKNAKKMRIYIEENDASDMQGQEEKGLEVELPDTLEPEHGDHDRNEIEVGEEVEGQADEYSEAQSQPIITDGVPVSQIDESLPSSNQNTLGDEQRIDSKQGGDGDGDGIESRKVAETLEEKNEFSEAQSQPIITDSVSVWQLDESLPSSNQNTLGDEEVMNSKQDGDGTESREAAGMVENLPKMEEDTERSEERMDSKQVDDGTELKEVAEIVEDPPKMEEDAAHNTQGVTSESMDGKNTGNTASAQPQNVDDEASEQLNVEAGASESAGTGKSEEIVILQRRARDLEELLAQKKKQLSEATMEISEKKEELTRIRREYDGRTGEQRGEIEQLRQAAAEGQEAMEKWKTEIEELDIKLQQAQVERSRFQEQCASLQSELEKSQSEAEDAIERLRAEKEAEINKLRSEKNLEMEKLAEEKDAQINSVRAEGKFALMAERDSNQLLKAEMQASQQTFDKRQQDFLSQIEGLKEMKTDALNELSTLKEQYQQNTLEKMAKIDELKSLVSSQQEGLTQQQQKLSEMEEEHGRKLAGKIQEISELQSRLEQQAETQQQQLTKISELQSRFEQLAERERLKLSELNASHEREMAAKNKRIDEMQALLDRQMEPCEDVVEVTQRNRIILLTGYKEGSELNELKEAIEVLGGTVRHGSFSSDVTHCIAQGRTAKLLKALLKGIWVMDQSWISASKSSGGFLNEQDYGRRITKKPFDGMNFSVTRGFNQEAEKRNAQLLKICRSFVKMGGGKFVELGNNSDYIFIAKKEHSNQLARVQSLTWEGFLEKIESLGRE